MRENEAGEEADWPNLNSLGCLDVGNKQETEDKNHPGQSQVGLGGR